MLFSMTVGETSNTENTFVDEPIVEILEEVPPKPKKKRGRPKKVKLIE